MKHLTYFLLLLLLCSCHNTKPAESVTAEPATAVGPLFMADSAYAYCQRQCDFGPRTMNSRAHDDCRDWIAAEFRRHGCDVTLQKAELKGYDGTMLKATNIIARYTPKALLPGDTTARPRRMLLCAHYDTRPWADNDADEKNHRTPVMGANDGASGVAVMLEVARLLSAADSAAVAVEFVCFDAEDYGTPQWHDGDSQVEDPWALGAQHWARQYAAEGRTDIAYGILLDMVGGEGARFFKEGMSIELARELTDTVWKAAETAGYGTMFPTAAGGYVTDDHVPVNNVAHIPCTDIIPYYADCPQSSFGPTWHTVNDTMEHISKHTLLAVGQTVIQMIYSK